jgi:hypothetical protein
MRAGEAKAPTNLAFAAWAVPDDHIRSLVGL